MSWPIDEESMNKYLLEKAKSLNRILKWTFFFNVCALTIAIITLILKIAL